MTVLAWCEVLLRSHANAHGCTGDYKQNGGEYLFENGDLKWCHRMKTTSDHAEIKAVKEVLGL